MSPGLPGGACRPARVAQRELVDPSNKALVSKHLHFELNTSQADLDGSFMDVTLSCVSELALTERKDNGIAFKTTNLRILFTDQCGLAQVTAANSVDKTIPLYQQTAININ